MTQVSSSFILRSKYPNFERDSFKTKNDMKTVSSSWMDEGHISYCVETKKHYIFSTAAGETGMARWHEIPFVVDNKKRDVLYVENFNSLNTLSHKEGTLIYVGSEDTYYFDNGSKFIKLINIDIDSKLKDYYNKENIGSWSTNTSLISHIDSIYAKKANTVTTDALKGLATTTYVDNKIISGNYISVGSFNDELTLINRNIDNTKNELNSSLRDSVNIINNKFNEYITNKTFSSELSNINLSILELGSNIDSKLLNYATIDTVVDNYNTLNNNINTVKNDIRGIKSDLLNYVSIGSYEVGLSQLETDMFKMGSNIEKQLNDQVRGINSKLSNYATTNTVVDNYNTLNNNINTVKNDILDIKSGLLNYVSIGSFESGLSQLETDMFKMGSNIENQLRGERTMEINAVKNDIRGIKSDLLKYVSIGSYESGLSQLETNMLNMGTNIENQLRTQVKEINSKLSNYATTNTVTNNYNTLNNNINTVKNDILDIKSGLLNYVSIGSFEIGLSQLETDMFKMGSNIENQLNDQVRGINSKFNKYVTTTDLGNKLSDYVTKKELSNNNSESDIIEINNKLSTLSAATGAVKQSLDNYKIEVDKNYVKKELLESDYVKGSTFQDNAAFTTNRLNELEDLIYGKGGVSLKSDLDEYKEFVENTYAKPEDISSKLNNYAPAEENRNKWISSDLAGDLSGLTGQEVASRAYSYNAVLDQILFGKFTPEITDPYVDVQLKDDWDGKGYIKWYDKEKRIIVVKSGSAGPDGGDFLPIDVKDSIISYPKGIDLSTNFTNGILPSTNLKQNSVGFCKIQDENGEWTYYRKDNNIYHVPQTLELGEYRYYMAAYFQKGSPALNNEGFIVDEWNENTAVESENYITIIASKPTLYNTRSGLIENPLVFWGDNMVDYMTLPPTCHAEQIFMLPKKVKELYIWNDIKGDYALVPMEYQRVEGVITNNLIPSYFDEIIGDDGYYMYKYDIDKHGHRGEIKIKVVF